MNIFQHKNTIKPPLLPVFISSVIQFDEFFHLVVLYENYLICIFMNINRNFCNERLNLRKNKGSTYKMTNVSPTMCSSVSNLVPIQSLYIVLLPQGIICKIFIMNIHEF